MEKELKTLTGIRNGKSITLAVEVSRANGLSYIRKADGSPIFGTTGYLKNGQSVIKTYREKILMTEVALS